MSKQSDVAFAYGVGAAVFGMCGVAPTAGALGIMSTTLSHKTSKIGNIVGNKGIIRKIRNGQTPQYDPWD